MFLQGNFKMGRYCEFGNGESFKFWVGIQPSGDILEYGNENEGISGDIDYDELDNIKEKVKGFKEYFQERFKITYEEFMEKIEKKGCLCSSNDKETKTEDWKKMLRLASKIKLGVVVIENLEKEKDGFSYYAEC